MPFEVELKARVANPRRTVARLRRHAVGERSVYQDTYYDYPDRRLEKAGREELRLRVIESEHGQRCLWTFKGAMLDAASTPEFETTVGDAQAARAILHGLGLEPVISYTKRCENYRFVYAGRPVLATVVRVPELDGTFLEVETVVPDDDDIADARHTVQVVLKEVGLDEGDLEPTFYVDMVRRVRNY